MVKRVFLAIGVLLLVVIAGTAGWYKWIYYPPRFSPAEAEAVAALASTSTTRVSRGRWIVMEPAGREPDTGFIFYPGGEVAPEGYAEPLRDIAAAGFLVVDVPMPFDLAVLAPDRAESVMAAYPGIRHWVIGGHSLGGAMAARFAARHPGRVEGLLLWDSYPDGTDDLSRQSLPVMQLHRLEPDGQAPEKYRETRHLLPAAAELVPLAGASHLNYGRFTPSERFRKSPPATLPIDEQHTKVVAASVEFLRRVGASRAPD